MAIQRSKMLGSMIGLGGFVCESWVSLNPALFVELFGNDGVLLLGWGMLQSLPPSALIVLLLSLFIF